MRCITKVSRTCKFGFNRLLGGILKKILALVVIVGALATTQTGNATAATQKKFTVFSASRLVKRVITPNGIDMSRYILDIQLNPAVKGIDCWVAHEAQSPYNRYTIYLKRDTDNSKTNAKGWVSIAYSLRVGTSPLVSPLLAFAVCSNSSGSYMATDDPQMESGQISRSIKPVVSTPPKGNSIPPSPNATQPNMPVFTLRPTLNLSSDVHAHSGDTLVVEYQASGPAYPPRYKWFRCATPVKSSESFPSDKCWLIPTLDSKEYVLQPDDIGFFYCVTVDVGYLRSFIGWSDSVGFFD